MTNVFPKNYFKEALVSLILGVIGLCTTMLPNEQYHDLLLTIGGGVFTGAIVHFLTFTMHSLRNRRVSMEKLLSLAENFDGRFRYIFRPTSVNQDNLYEFQKMIDETENLDEIFGELWFLRKKNRNAIHDLYQVIFEVQMIKFNIMQHEMIGSNSKWTEKEENEWIESTELTKKEWHMIKNIQERLDEIFKNHKGRPEIKIENGIENLRKLIEKSWF